MRKAPVVALLLVLAALPLSASQFIQMPFDRIVKSSPVIVRATVGPVMSAWDDAHEVIYSTATLEVARYIGGSGPAILQLKEVGGTVNGYTQEAIGFPALREGEDVVLMLAPWDDSSTDMRIQAYSQGKYLVFRDRAGRERLVHDPVSQGDDRLNDSRFQTHSTEDGLTLDEFTSMVDAIRRSRETVERTPVE